MSCFSSFLKVCVRRLAKGLQLSSGGSLKLIGPKWSHTCSRKDTCSRKEDGGLGFQDLDTVLKKTEISRRIFERRNRMYWEMGAIIDAVKSRSMTSLFSNVVCKSRT